MARVLGVVRKLPGPLHEFLCSTIEQSERVYYHIARQYLISMLFQRWNQKKKKKLFQRLFQRRLDLRLDTDGKSQPVGPSYGCIIRITQNAAALATLVATDPSSISSIMIVTYNI